jgi:hypothetical protein
MLENISRIACTLAVALCVAACGGGGSSSGTSSPSSSSTASSATSTPQVIGFEGMPIEQGTDLAPPGTTGTGTVDGITCAPAEQLVYHIHAHLTVYVNGAPRALPGGIGIPGSKVVNYQQDGPVALGGRCIYWLHTHAPDGVIHIESPIVRVYTLGEFFDEWRQPLSSTDVAGATGRVTAFVDGKPWTASPRAIPLLPHAVIQLDVGSPTVPFQQVSWAGVQL